MSPAGAVQKSLEIANWCTHYYTWKIAIYTFSLKTTNSISALCSAYSFDASNNTPIFINIISWSRWVNIVTLTWCYIRISGQHLSSMNNKPPWVCCPSWTTSKISYLVNILEPYAIQDDFKSSNLNPTTLRVSQEPVLSMVVQKILSKEQKPSRTQIHSSHR